MAGKGSRWTHLRVDRATVERLESLRKRLEDAAIKGQTPLQIGRWDRLSMDSVINALLDERMMHDARRRKHARKRKGEPTLDATSQAMS